MPDYRIRRATAADAALLARYRVAMLSEMDELPDADAPIIERSSCVHMQDEFASGVFSAWVTELDGNAVAGAGVLLHAKLPHAWNPRGRPVAHILNVYTEPAHRRRGLASDLIREILSWCAANDIPQANLRPSAAGRHVYERLGFAPLNEMQLTMPRG